MEQQADAGEFAVTGLPPGFGPARPFVLGPGERLELGLVYAFDAAGRRPDEPRDLNEDVWQTAGPEDDRPDRALDRSDLARTIVEAIASLPDDQQAVVHLVVVEQFSYDEASDMLSVPVGTVKSRLNRARARLCALLDGVKDTEPRDGAAENVTHLKLVQGGSGS